ncbi:MAG: M4 family metallopeptidase [Bacteroidota bacterium]|nr:M4 family metallopeptidase [Bacteroidota bacterium]
MKKILILVIILSLSLTDTFGQFKPSIPLQANSGKRVQFKNLVSHLGPGIANFDFIYQQDLTLKPISLQQFTKGLDQLTILSKNEDGFISRFKTKAPLVPRTSSTEAFWSTKIKNYLDLENWKDLNFKLVVINHDELDIDHQKFQQLYKGIPVYGAEYFIHIYPNQTILGHGDIQVPEIEVNVPKLNELQVSQQVSEYLIFKGEKLNLTTSVPFLKTGLLESALCYWKNPTTGQWFLAYRQIYKPNPVSSWELFVNSENGEILHAYSNICKLHNHDLHKTGICNMPPDGAEIAVTNDLFNISRTINVWKEGNTFYLIDGSRSMFNASTSKMPDDPVGTIWTLDGLNKSPTQTSFSVDHVKSSNNTWNGKANAVSAHYNGGKAFEYFKNVHGRNSIDGTGGTIISLVNIADEDGSNLDNAFWDGSAMYYGNGNRAFTSLAKSLDVAGHEMSHGVIQKTANLAYQGESGAINESFADIFGAMIDREDWKLGEDVVVRSSFPSGALRDLSNPNNGANPNSNGWQPKHVVEQYRGTEDNGGVHINSGISNHAYYLFVQELAKSRTEEQGKVIAEKIYYRALNNYLTRSSQFKDLRASVEQAASDLHGSGEVLNAVKKAYDLVGILGAGGGTGGGNYQKDLSVNPGREFIICTDDEKNGVYLIDVLAGTSDQLSQTAVLSKPSITDDGSAIYFVADDNTLHSLILNPNTGIYQERIEDNTPSYRNVVISKDGKLLAALSSQEENFLYIFSFARSEWHTFELINPTYTDGITTSNVQYADFMDFDHAGQFVMYDAFNELTQQGGATYTYWDIGFINVWDLKTTNFTSGKIEKLFSELPENTSVGNPVFSKNSPYIICFDYLEEGLFSSTFRILGGNIETGEVNTIVDGRDDTGYPSYSVKDNLILFDGRNPSSSEAIKFINVGPTKIKPSGTEQLLIDGAKWGTWFANGKRKLLKTEDNKLIESISYAPNPVQGYLNISIGSIRNLSLTIEVYTSIGLKVHSEKRELSEGKNNFDVNLNFLSEGLYHVVLKSKQGQSSFSIMKSL